MQLVIFLLPFLSCFSLTFPPISFIITCNDSCNFISARISLFYRFDGRNGVRPKRHGTLQEEVLMEPIASPTWSDLLQTIKEKKYRVSADYLLREIAGEYAIIPVGAACQISNAVMVPNDTAVFLWNTFQQPHTISEVVAQAAEEYEAPEEKIQDSVLNFVHDTLKYQLLEEVVSL